MAITTGKTDGAGVVELPPGGAHHLEGARSQLAYAEETPNFSLMSILWLPITLFWSAVMAQVLAERVEFFTGSQKGLYLAIMVRAAP
jgi:hypothetical protein